MYIIIQRSDVLCPNISATWKNIWAMCDLPRWVAMVFLQQPQKDRKNSWRPGSISWTHNQVLVLAGHSLRSSASLPGGDLEVQVREKCLSIPKLSESITMVCVDMSIPSMTHFTAEHELPRLSLCLSHLYPFIHATTVSENKVTRNPKVNHHPMVKSKG